MAGTRTYNAHARTSGPRTNRTRKPSATDIAFAKAVAARRAADAAAVIVVPPASAAAPVPAGRPVNLANIANQYAIRETALARLHADARPERIVSIDDAARMLGLAESTVRRYGYRTGTRPARLVKVGRGVSLASVEALLNR